MAKMLGVINQFGSQGYGFIQGDDGEKYFFHKQDIKGKKKVKVKAKVQFVPYESEKGAVAKNITILNNNKVKKEATNKTITILLLVIIALQIVSIYLTLK